MRLNQASISESGNCLETEKSRNLQPMEQDSPSNKQPHIVVMTSPRRSWRQFFSASLRLALSLTLTVCFCGIVAGVLWGIYQWREAKAALPLEVAKTWKPENLDALGGGVATLKTKLVSGSLHYQLETDIAPKIALELAETLKAPHPASSYLIVTFSDNDGFNQFEKKIPLSDFQIGFETNGVPKKLFVDQQTPCSAELYQRFSRWGFGWNF